MEMFLSLLNCNDNQEALAFVSEQNFREVKTRHTERQYIDNIDKIFETL